jgi:hypothetical protein
VTAREIAMEVPPADIYEVETFSLQTFRYTASAGGETLTEIPFPTRWLSTATARWAMVHVLTYLRMRGVLENKNSQLLVPQWLCLSFLQLLRKYSSPTLDVSQPVKVAIPYHQYGFPQDMDEVLDYADRKGIVLVEDCANLFEGYYRGKRLGTFGLASIFSLSKVFPSIWEGEGSPPRMKRFTSTRWRPSLKCIGHGSGL